MARYVKIHDGSDGDFGFSIDPDKTKNYIRNGSKSRTGTSNNTSFLKSVMRAVKSGNSVKTGKHLYVKNPPNASQRVLVKARVVRHSSPKKSRESLQHHCSYLTRKGTEKTPDRSPEVYSKDGTFEASQQDNFINEASQDRHHFRFIISPENAHHLDLTCYVKEVVEQMETDLGTKLEYMAVNHYNTDNPHAHIVIRGKDSNGKDLVISKDYISNGVRNRACEIANSHLGLRSELEIRNGITKDIDRLAFTQLDRELKKILTEDIDNFIDLTLMPRRDSSSMTQFKRQALERRLEFLESLHLAKEIDPGVWKLRDDFEQHLRELGMRNDIINNMNKCLSQGNSQEKVVFDISGTKHIQITGMIIGKGVFDELNDSLYVVVSATDNRLYYVQLPRNYQLDSGIKHGSIVTITNEKQRHVLLKSDQKIIEVAAKNQGIYTPDNHRKLINQYRLPENVTLAMYLENFLKRMKTLERLHVVERVGEAVWSIPKDFEKRLANSGKSEFKIEHEANDLTQQIHSETPAWIDGELVAGRLPDNETRGSDFLQELNQAKEKRLGILLDRGIAVNTPDGLSWQHEFTEKLRQPRKLNRNNQENEQGLDR